MSFRTKLPLILAVLVLPALTALPALAAPPAPGVPQAPAVTAAQSPATLSSPAGPACKSADLPLFSPAPQATATDVCGACSDAACVGKAPNAVCGPAGFRCITGGPSCAAVPMFRCRCLLI